MAFRDKLIEDWRQAWRWFSMQAMAAAGTVQLAWVSLPDDLRRSIPPAWVTGITVALLVAGIAGRLVKQDAACPPKAGPG
jgi:hypothetical protein